MLICHIYFRDDRDAPKKTMISPIPTPTSSPTRTRLISIPSNKPSTIANIKAISPLLIPGFLSVLMLISLRPLSFTEGFRGKVLKRLFFI